jgi:hypothetical protein
MNNQIKILVTINGITGATIHNTAKKKIPFNMLNKVKGYGALFSENFAIKE